MEKKVKNNTDISKIKNLIFGINLLRKLVYGQLGLWCIVFPCFLLMASHNLNAQSHTTGTAAKTDSLIQYLTPLEYAFMMHEETKFMLRFSAIAVGAEVELLPYLTLLGQLYIRNNGFYRGSSYVLASEMRYYYGSKKKGIRNMSGNYFAIGYETPDFLRDNYNEDFYYGRWGIQRRFIGYGLIDMGINAGFTSQKIHNSRNDYTYFRNALQIQTTAQVGLGYVFGKQKVLDKEKLCPVIKCYEKETFLLKIKTSSFFSLYKSLSNGENWVLIDPKIAVEQKLFNWPVSIGVDLGLNYIWFTNAAKHRYDEDSHSEGSLSGRFQTRYYYNLKNRIRKGKSGNGLSANYVSAGVYESSSIINESINRYWAGYTISTGIQRTFSDHFYFDVEIGLQAGEYRYSSYGDVFGDIQLGIKF